MDDVIDDAMDDAIDDAMDDAIDDAMATKALVICDQRAATIRWRLDR